MVFSPYTNINLTNPQEGLLYANAVPLTGGEVDLCTLIGPDNFDPLPVLYGRAVFATVVLAAVGSPGAGTRWVVMQQSLDRVNWIDVAWIISTITTGTQLFALSATMAANNAIQQTRNSGIAPASNGSNALTIGGSIRFTGGSSGVGSSSASGSPSMVTATIYAKILGLRR